MNMTVLLCIVIGVNLVSFTLSSLNLLSIRKKGKSLRIPGLIKLFVIAGGAFGSLLSYLIFDRHLDKENLMPFLYNLLWFMVQLLAGFAVLGPNREITLSWFERLLQTQTVLCIYLAVVNLVTFLLYAIDKIKAMANRWRIREVVLLLFSFLGGSLGAMIAMDLCNHKINTQHFAVGVPMMMIFHLLLALTAAIGVI